MTDKERGYTKQWAAVLAASEGSPTIDEYNERLGVLENYEPFV